MAQFNLRVNGKKHQLDLDPQTPILWVLRDHLRLVGTKYGCGIAQCGVCIIHIDGSPVRSCIIPVSAIGSREITTIEGLDENASHPVLSGVAAPSARGQRA